MIDTLLMIWIFSVVLIAIHSYFGLKIVERNIIFTDLAIGQAAAVGVAVSIAFLHSEYVYVLSLFSALSVAFIIAYAQKRVKNIEAFIGLLYVLGASIAMLVLSNSSAHASESFASLLASDILFVSFDEILKSVTIYFFIAVALIYILPKLKGAFYEILFFTLFSFTITTSVKLVGVFVVFVMLIAPAYSAYLQNRFERYRFSIVFGVLSTTFALAGSFYFDLSTGYTIVFCNAILAIGMGLCLQRTN